LKPAEKGELGPNPRVVSIRSSQAQSMDFVFSTLNHSDKNGLRDHSHSFSVHHYVDFYHHRDGGS
jgi:hypothetical protein